MGVVDEEEGEVRCCGGDEYGGCVSDILVEIFYEDLFDYVLNRVGVWVFIKLFKLVLLGLKNFICEYYVFVIIEVNVYK